MYILILSDSHGSLFNLEEILKRERGADMIIHLGDGADDMMLMTEYTAGKSVYLCKGNCDSSVYGFAEKVLLPIDGVTVFGCHGHVYGVKYGLQKIFYAAKEAGANICLFGHTHEPLCNIKDNVHILNPGSVRGGNYAVIHIVEGQIKTSCKVIQ